MRRLIVDGMNVIGSRPDGWWRDRDGAVRRLLEQLQRLAAASAQSVTLVLDGRPLPELGEDDHGGVTVRYAERGRSADDRIVAMVAADPEPASLEVVTADRELRRRVGECGARVSGPGGLLARLR